MGAVTACLAQKSKAPIGYNAEDNWRAWGTTRTSNAVLSFNDRYEGVKGSPFLFDDWQIAEVVLARGDTAFTKLKLDLFAHEAWVILSTGDSLIVRPGIIKSITFTDASGNQRRFVFTINKKETGYYETLYEGDQVSLACKRRKELKKAVISGAYTTGNPYDEFFDESPRYFIIRNHKPVLFRQRPKDVADILGAKAKQYYDQQRINLTNEEELVRLVRAADEKEHM
jgi:hypothetical protein